ncbi:MAG: hypothetical protein LBS24_07330 [Clostridiales Family XIII bacterium]|nr:hypothetical protein [Clostridiales Family XIII bacterium]
MKHEVIKRLGAIRAFPDGKTREVCVVRWDDGPPVLDVRFFEGEDMVRIRPRSTFTRKEAELLRNILNGFDLGELPE